MLTLEILTRSRQMAKHRRNHTKSLKTEVAIAAIKEKNTLALQR